MYPAAPTCEKFAHTYVKDTFNVIFFIKVTTVKLISDKLQAAALTHPVDEKGLDKLDDLQCDQKTDGDQIVEQDDKGEEVEAKVSRPAIYQGTSVGQREVIHRRLISAGSQMSLS